MRNKKLFPRALREITGWILEDQPMPQQTVLQAILPPAQGEVVQIANLAALEFFMAARGRAELFNASNQQIH